MGHERSETVLIDGKWVNVFGRDLPKAGQQLPGTKKHEFMVDALKEAITRSNEHVPSVEEFGLIDRDIIHTLPFLDRKHRQSTKP